MAPLSYAVLAEVKRHLKIPTDVTDRDEWIEWIVPIVSRQIDDHCHRSFYPRTASRVYDYQTPRKLYFKDDLDSVTQVLHGASRAEVLSTSSYFLYPEIGPPYQWLELSQASVVQLRWDTLTPQQSIQIEGVWGYLENHAIPNRVTMACCDWIKYLYLMTNVSGVRSKTIGDYSISYSQVLDNLRAGPPNEVGFTLEHFVRRTNFATNLKEHG